FRHVRQCLHRRDHIFRISAVVAHPANLDIRAGNEISAPAREANAILATVPADPDAFAFFPFADTSAYVIDNPGHLVTGNAGVRYTRKEAFFCYNVTVTDAAGLNANPHVSGGGFWDVALYDFEVRSGFWYLHSFHFSCHFFYLRFFR